MRLIQVLPIRPMGQFQNNSLFKCPPPPVRPMGPSTMFFFQWDVGYDADVNPAGAKVVSRSAADGPSSSTFRSGVMPFNIITSKRV